MARDEFKAGQQVSEDPIAAKARIIGALATVGRAGQQLVAGTGLSALDALLAVGDEQAKERLAQEKIPELLYQMLPGEPLITAAREKRMPSLFDLGLTALDAPDLTGLGKMGAKALLKGMPPIVAFHGTGVAKPFAKFSKEFIGSGEGAQAFGYGLYFAESPGVAGEYRRMLARPDMTVGGKRLLQVFPGASEQALDVIADAAKVTDATETSSIGAIRAKLSPFVADNPDSKALQEAWQQVNRPGLRSYEEVKIGNPGHLYRVKINAEPEDFLDWDKPLSEQSEPIKEKLRSAFSDYFGGARQVDDYMESGADPRDLIRNLDDLPENGAEELMREAGIPGIRYLDAGSRAGGGAVGANRGLFVRKSAAGDAYEVIEDATFKVKHRAKSMQEAEKWLESQYATRNIVLFDEDLIDILEVNGKPVESAGRRKALDELRVEGGLEPKAKPPAPEDPMAQRARLIGALARRTPK